MQELDYEVIMQPDLDLREWYLTNRRLLLEKEKQQIIDAVDASWDIENENGFIPTGEDYYNKKYNGNGKNA